MEIINLNYQICQKCGAYHDDGTFDYCLRCLDDQVDQIKNPSKLDTKMSPLEILLEAYREGGL